MFFDRTGGQQITPTQQRSKTKMFRGPSRGWVRANDPGFPAPGSAYILRNFFPTREGGKLRGGSLTHATLDASVGALMSYDATVKKLFAADASKIYDVTLPADPLVAETAVVSGLTNGNWSSVQFTTAGGTFLVAVNGADDMYQFDGLAFYPVNNEAVTKLHYDTQTGEFAVGLTVTGGTSTATGDIVGIYDNGTAGTLYLKNVSGTFQDNEAITDTGTGAADSDIPAGVDTGPSITGVPTADLSQVWSFKGSLLFVEEGTMSAWYLPVKSVGGAATEFPLGSVFRKGGALLFGATWSQDAGDGMDDICIFVTTNGEVAGYQGTGPSSWELIGVYEIARPLDKQGHFRGGGDLGILTEDGITSVSMATQVDRAAIQGQTSTAPIENAWRDYVGVRVDGSERFSVSLWHSESMLMVGLPSVPGLEYKSFVSNVRTGAWAEYTGWDIRCQVVHDNQLYFGTGAGTVEKANVTGKDNSNSYTGVFLSSFDAFKNAQEKAALHCEAIARTDYPYTIQIFANADHNVSIPNSLPIDSFDEAPVWDTAIWDGGVLWQSGEEVRVARTSWQTVHACGYALAPGITITSGQNLKPDFEIVGLHLQYEQGVVL